MPPQKKLEDDEIVQRSMQAFWATGWSGTSIRDLEAALDLTAPTIYRRIGSKDDLFVAAVGHYVDHIVERRIAKYLSPESADPLGDLWAFCSSALAAGQASRFQGCLLTLAANEAPELSPTARRAVMTGIERIRQATVEAVERAADAGQLETDEPETLGDQVAVAMQGLLVLSRGGANGAEIERQAIHALHDIQPDGATLALQSSDDSA